MNEIHSKIQRNLGVVRKIARFLDRQSLMQLYHSLIMSHIRNGIIVWHHSNIALRKKIQACSNKFLRMIFFLKPRDSVRSLMKENNLLSVNQIYHLEVCKLMQAFSLNALPNSIIDIFQGQVKLSSTSLRGATSVIQGASRTAKCAQSIRCTGPKLWNQLPKEIRFLSSGTDQTSVSTSPRPIKSFVHQMIL